MSSSMNKTSDKKNDLLRDTWITVTAARQMSLQGTGDLRTFPGNPSMICYPYNCLPDKKHEYVRYMKF